MSHINTQTLDECHGMTINRMAGPDCAVMCNLTYMHTHTLFPLAMSTCGEVGSDMHALVKEFAIRRVEHRSETHSNESQHLAEGTEVARLRRRFSFALQQALSFRTRHHLCRLGVALANTRHPRSQGPLSIQAHRTERVTGLR